MEGGRERETHPCVVASPASLTGALACKPSMCPDWESNQQPFGSEAGTQSTEPHQPGREIFKHTNTDIQGRRPCEEGGEH